MSRKVHIVGGPADGTITHILSGVRKLAIPTLPPPGYPSTEGDRGFGQFLYAIWRLRDRAGAVVEVAAPAGEEIPQGFLDERGLTIEQ